LSNEQFHKISFCHDENTNKDAQSEKNIHPDIPKGDTCIAFEKIKNRGALCEIKGEKK